VCARGLTDIHPQAHKSTNLLHHVPEKHTKEAQAANIVDPSLQLNSLHCRVGGKIFIFIVQQSKTIVVLSFSFDVNWPSFVKEYRLVSTEFEAAVPAALREFLDCQDDATIRKFATPLVTEELETRPVVGQALWPVIDLYDF
jgi:hypothetical protein